MKLVFLSIFFAVFSSAKTTNTVQSPNTATVDGVSYRAILNGDQSISIKAGNKTVFRARRADLYITFEHFSKMEFKDFNGDSYPDLVVDYKSNVPDRRDLILYDKLTKKFIQVTGFPDYPASTHIPNTMFYYSYHRSGCDDSDWDSDLYKIEKFKVVPVANLAGRNCPNSDEEKGIFINKLTGKKVRLINKLPTAELTKYNNDKLNFINTYWTQNYMKL